MIMTLAAWSVVLVLALAAIGLAVWQGERDRRRDAAGWEARRAVRDAEWAAEQAAREAAWKAERAAQDAKWEAQDRVWATRRAALSAGPTAGVLSEDDEVRFEVVFPAGVPRERIDRALAAIAREGGEVA